MTNVPCGGDTDEGGGFACGGWARGMGTSVLSFQIAMNLTLIFLKV